MKIHKKMLVAGLILIMLLAISGCGRKNIKIALYQYTENEDGTLTITAGTTSSSSDLLLQIRAGRKMNLLFQQFLTVKVYPQ